MKKIGRNDPCHCGSGKKYKNCCMPNEEKQTIISEHGKRMFNISRFTVPPPWSDQFEEFNKFYKDVIGPNINKKEVKQLFNIAVSSVTYSILDGAGLLCDQNLRYFFQEFNDRLFNHGLWSFPSSFNVCEAFMQYIPKINCFSLLSEIDYLFSLEDYMEFVTSSTCKNDFENALTHFEESKIYNFNNSDDLKNFTSKTKDGKEYVLGGCSLVRHGNELNIIMTIGEVTDTKLKDEEIKKVYKWEQSKHPAKKKLKPDKNRKLEAVRLNDIENLWHQIILSRFDFSDMTQNVRYLMEDYGQSFMNSTDDMSVFTNEHGAFDNKSIEETIKSMAKRLNIKSALFELSKFMIYLPLYFKENEDNISVERHPTQLIQFLKENKTSERELKIDKNKYFCYRNVHLLPKKNLISPDIFTTKAPGLKIETNGFWKKLKPHQVGVNKKGDPIHGKTWVEQKLTWLETDEEEAVTLYKLHYNDIKEGSNEGIIYVMRSAAHEKDIFKVGLTTRTSKIRSDELSSTTGSPDKFLVVEEWKVSDCYSAEKEIHKKLQKYRINPNREFFQVPYDVLRKEISEILSKYLL